jgi:phosphoglycerate dehydrogenase-like enzyme
MNICFLAAQLLPGRLLTDTFLEAINACGALTIYENTGEWTEQQTVETIGRHDVLLTGWGSRRIPASIAAKPGRLRYICHLTGTLRGVIPGDLINSDIPVTNWGDAPAGNVAEAAFTLLLASLRNIPHHVLQPYDPHCPWKTSDATTETCGKLSDLRLGCYGFGAIAQHFHQLCIPFQPAFGIYDPFAKEIPSGCLRFEDLDNLFAWADAVAIHAGLNATTRHSVGARQLAMLPDGGIIINTARGGIIDQNALFAELRAGRLRAGLDVLDGRDCLEPEDADMRQLPNLILTSHVLGRASWPPPRQGEKQRLSNLHLIALDNLNRFKTGQPLRFVMDAKRYELST